MYSGSGLRAYKSQSAEDSTCIRCVQLCSQPYLYTQHFTCTMLGRNKECMRSHTVVSGKRSTVLFALFHSVLCSTKTRFHFGLYYSPTKLLSSIKSNLQLQSSTVSALHGQRFGYLLNKFGTLWMQ